MFHSQSTDESKSEFMRWKAGVDTQMVIPVSRLWPGCAGMAVLLDGLSSVSADGHWVPGGSLSFVSQTVIPTGYFTESPNREVRYVSVSCPVVRNGVLSLGQSSRILDFRKAPFDVRDRGGWSIEAGSTQAPLALNTRKESRLLRVLNRVTEGMQAAGIRLQDDWWQAVSKRDKLTSRPPIPCGETEVTDLPATRFTFPVPYVRVPALTPRSLLVSQTYRGVLPRPLIQSFCRAVAKGLPVRAPVSGTYGGIRRSYRDRDYLMHILRKDSKEVLLKLPKFSLVTKRPGDHVTEGESMGNLVLAAAKDWERKPFFMQWLDLRKQWGEELLLDVVAEWLKLETVFVYGESCLPYPLLATYMALLLMNC